MSTLRERYMLWRYYSRFYSESGAPLECVHCGGKKFSTEVVDATGWVLCEYSEYCEECNKQVAYWCYGGYQCDEPLTWIDVIGLGTFRCRISARILSLTRTLTGKGKSDFPIPRG